LRYTEGFQLFVSIDYQAIFLIFFFNDDENHTFRLLTTSAYLKTLQIK
jgi:hypothetical protein